MKIGNFRRSRFKEEKNQLSNELPWLLLDSLGRAGVVYNKDGSLQTTFSFRGPDLDSSTRDELAYYHQRINTIMKLVPTGYTFYMEQQRRKAAPYEAAQMPDAFTQTIENEREEYFNAGTHFEDQFFFTIVYRTPTPITEKILSYFEKSDKSVNAEEEAFKAVESFAAEAEKVISLFSDVFTGVHILTPDEMATYLHSTVSDRYHAVLCKPTMFLSTYLCDSDLIGGLEPKLGEKHMRVISLLSFPNMTSPASMDIFRNIGFEFRWVNRFICVSKADMDKEFKQLQQNWAQQSKTLLQYAVEAIRNMESAERDQSALNNAAEVSLAQQELQADETAFGYYTGTIIILDNDKEAVEQKANLLLKEINKSGFVAKVETVNAVSAWFGSLPGLWLHNIRRHLISSLNFSHTAPTSSIWSGDQFNAHLKGPVLLHTDTAGATPFRLNLHVRDVGHTLIIGPTGSGKSVLLNMIELHFKKYRDSRCYIFDKAGSSRCLTKAVDGNFYNLIQDEKALAFQPLARVNEETEKTWASDWICNYLEGEKVEIHPREKKLIWDALTSVAGLGPKERTLSSFVQLVQDTDIRQAMLPLTKQGAYGKLFDASEDRFGSGNWQVFEMETLMNSPAIVPPTLDYLFHRIEGQLREDGAPALMVLDECWLFLTNPAFQAKLREYFKDMRKKNTSLVLATQNLSDIASAPSLANAVLENCQTQIYLPNPKATNETIAKQYKDFGLNARQIDLLTKMQPKKHYYYNSILGNRIFDLAICPLEGAFVTATSKEDQLAMNHFEAQGLSREEFIIEWLKHRGQHGTLEKLLSNKDFLNPKKIKDNSMVTS